MEERNFFHHFDITALGILIYIRIIIGLCAVTLVSILLNCFYFNFMSWIRFFFEYLFHLPLVVYCIKQVKREQDYKFKLYKFIFVLFFVQCVLKKWIKRLVGINPYFPIFDLIQKIFPTETMQSCRFVALYCVGLFSTIFFYVDKVIGTRRRMIKISMVCYCLFLLVVRDYAYLSYVSKHFYCYIITLVLAGFEY